MTMIAVGQNLRDLAFRGYGAMSKADTIENQQRMALKAQKRAAASSTMGTGAGIGGMIGAGKIAESGRAATEAIGTLNKSIQGSGTVGIKGGGLTFQPTGGELLQGAEAKAAIDTAAIKADVGSSVRQGIEAINAAKDAGTVAGATGGTVGGATGGTVGGATGGTVGGATGGTVAGAGTTTTTAVAGEVAAANAAAASTGPMASLATLAAPVAIGLGVAFLLNKLFD
jgi:hypothetical protein